MSDDKECFFIAPIGDEGSEVRDRSNKVMEYIVEKAVSEYEYSVKRADQMDQPGSITSQIIQKTVNSELVIADLTGHNPNVFYELAVRHATGEPYIQLIQSNSSIPFDISDLRTIKYGLEVDKADQAVNKICRLLQQLEEGEPEFDNPISESAEMQSLRESSDPADQNLAEILQIIYKLDSKMENLESVVMDSNSTPGFEDDEVPGFEDARKTGVVEDARKTGFDPVDKIGLANEAEVEVYETLKRTVESTQDTISKDELVSAVNKNGINKNKIERALVSFRKKGLVSKTEDGQYMPMIK